MKDNRCHDAPKHGTGLNVFSRCLINKRSGSGFTLLEVMVTVAIIGVLAGLAIGGIQNLLPKFRLNSAARQVSGDMQKCKMVAVRNNTACLMVFTEGAAAGDAGSYEACFSDGSSCAGEPMVLTGDLNDDDFVGVWINDVTLSGSPPRVMFESRGIANKNGGVQLKNNNGELRKLNILKTGRIRIK